jgi:hypothetical protein
MSRQLTVTLYPKTRASGADSQEVVLSWPDQAVVALTAPCRDTSNREDVPLLMAGKTNGQRKDENVLSRSMLVFDIDCKRLAEDTQAAWNSRRGKTQAAFDRALLKMKPHAYIWHTTHSHDGGERRLGYRLWIPLAEDVTGEELKQWPKVLDAFNQAVLEGIGDDKCFNLERLMRLPALNSTYPTALFQSGSNVAPLLPWHTAKGYIGLYSAPRKRGETWAPKTYNKDVKGAFPLASDTVAALRRDCAEWARKESRLQGDTLKALASVALASALEPGHRDNGLTGLLGIFANRFLAFEPRPLLESLLAPVLEATHAAAPNDPIKPGCADPKDLLEFCIQEVERRRAENQKTVGHIAVNDGERAQILRWSNGARNSGMTKEELEAAAQRLGLTAEQLTAQLFIQFKESVYVWTIDRYFERTLSRGELSLETAQAVLAGVGLSRKRFDPVKAAFKPLTLNEILARHGGHARGVRGSFLAERAYYDAADNVFVEAFAPRARLEPKHHEDVQEWLLALGGEVLVDWVSAVPKVDKPLSILLLAGKRHSGKGLLAHGLSRLWAAGTPARAKEVLTEPFNSDLAKSPLIFADEELPKVRGQSLGATLREIITAPSMPLKRKWEPNVDIEGYVRILISANNMNALRDFSDQHQPVEEDLLAIAERLLVVHVSPEAKKVLDRVENLDEWRKGNKIAEHALWLAQHHKIAKPGRRFLVEGNGEESLRVLLVADGLTSQLLEWFLTFALKASKTRGLGRNDQERQAHLRSDLFSKGGELYVHLGAITSTWEVFRPSYRMGSSEPFLAALDSISHPGRERVRRFGEVREFWHVRLDYLEFYARRLGYSSAAVRQAVMEKVDLDAVFVDDDPTASAATVSVLRPPQSPAIAPQSHAIESEF